MGNVVALSVWWADGTGCIYEEDPEWPVMAYSGPGVGLALRLRTTALLRVPDLAARMLR